MMKNLRKLAVLLLACGAFSASQADSVNFYTYYRFTFKAPYSNDYWGKPIIQLSELTLYDADNNKVTSGITTLADVNTDAADLAAGSVAFGTSASLNSMQSYWYSTGESPEKIFDGSTSTKFCSYPYLYMNVTNSATWFTITFRLPTSVTTAPTSYTWTTANDETPARNPAAWTVEGSTNGTDWVELDSQSGQGATPTAYTTESSAYAISTSFAPAEPVYVCRTIQGDVTNSYTTLSAGITALSSGASRFEILTDLTLDADYTIPTGLTFSSPKGEGPYTITRGGDYSFTISANVLLADSESSITFDGNNVAATKALFQVTAGAGLWLSEGSTIQNCRNTSTTSFGGAICVQANGSTSLNGGTITGCSAVKGGAVYLAQNAVTSSDLYKVTVTTVHTSTKGLALSEFALYNAAGVRVNQGTFTYNSTATSASELAAGEAMLELSSGLSLVSGTSVANLFDGDTSTNLRVSGSTLDGSGSAAIIFRLSSAAEVTGYTFNLASISSTWKYGPTAWTVSKSTDGGTSWTVISDQSDQQDYMPSAQGANYRLYAIDGGIAIVSSTSTVEDNTLLDGTTINNVEPASGTQITLDEGFTGSVGVSWPTSGTAAAAEGQVFGSKLNAADGATACNFFWDGNSSVTGVVSDAMLVWGELPQPETTYVCQVKETQVQYETLAEGLAAVTAGQTLELLQNLDLDANYTLDKNFTLTSVSGQSYTLTRTGDYAFTVNEAVTLTNITFNGASVEATSALFTVSSNATLTVQNDTTIQNCMNASDTNYGGAICASGTVNLTGGTISGCSAAKGGAVYIASEAGTPASASYEWYKFTFTTGRGTFSLSEIALYDADGSRINQGTYTVDTATANTLTSVTTNFSSLANSSVTYTLSASRSASREDVSLANLFDGSSTSCGTLKDAFQDNKTLTVVFRVAAGSNAAASYMLYTGSKASRAPTAWTVSRSSDGITWEQATDGTVTVTQPSSTSSAYSTTNYKLIEATAGTGTAVAGYSGTLNVSGAPTVADNTLTDGTLNNVEPSAADQITLAGAFTGSVGVSWPTNVTATADALGQQFGTNGVASVTDAAKFFWDGDGANVVGKVSGSTLIWAAPPVCQIGSTTYTTLAAGLAAVQDGETLEILKDLDLDQSYTLDKDFTLTSVSGASYTLTRTGDYAFTVTGETTLGNITLDGGNVNASSALFVVNSGATLTIPDGTTILNCKNTSTTAFGGAVYAAGAVNVTGGTITGCSAAKGGAIYLTGTLAVSGNPTIVANTLTDGTTVNNVEPASATQITLAGELTGKVGVNWPTSGTADDAEGVQFGVTGTDAAGAEGFRWDGAPEELEGEISGSTLVWALVSKDPVCQIGTTTYTSLKKALDAAKDGDTIELLANITQKSALTIDKNVTITSAAGSTYSITRGSSAATLNVTGNATLTNITLDGASVSASDAFVTVAAGGTLNVQSGTTITNCVSTGNGGAINNAGTVNLTGGSITGNTAASGAGIYSSGTLNVSGNPSVTGNTATDSSASSVVLTGTSALQLTGAFTGTVGIDYPASVTDGAQFGVISSGYTATASDARHFVCENGNEFRGSVSGSTLVWKEAGSAVYPDGSKTIADILEENDDSDDPLTIYIGEDASADDIVIPTNRNVVIDLQGHTLTGNITANGNVTITDSTTAKEGKLVGTLTEGDGGDLTLEWGNYTATLSEDWLGEDKVIVENTDGTSDVTTMAMDGGSLANLTLDTRRGVRVVDDPAEDVLPLTYASSNWVYRASTNPTLKCWVAIAAAWPKGTPDEAPMTFKTNVNWHVGMTDIGLVPRGDKSYDYNPADTVQTGNMAVTNDTNWVTLYDQDGESAVDWHENHWGLIEAIHTNMTGVARAWFKYPDPRFDAVQRDNDTAQKENYWDDQTSNPDGRWEITLNEKWLKERWGWDRMTGDEDTLAEIRSKLSDFDPNGLRVWENLVLDLAPSNQLLTTVTQSKDGSLALDIPNTGKDSQYGYDIKYVLRRVTNYWEQVSITNQYYSRKKNWTEVSPRGDSPNIPIPLRADDKIRDWNASGLYRIWTLIIPDTSKAITNEIPATNIIGVLKVVSPCTNTITAIPWMHLTTDPAKTTPVTVSEVVNASNLNAGDRLYYYDNETGLYYGYLMMEDAETGALTWEGMTNVSMDGVTTTDATRDTLPRGGAIWTARTKPNVVGGDKAGKIDPYFVCGQHLHGSYTNTVKNGTYATPGSTPIANPTPFDVCLNDIEFEGTIGATDTIVIPSVNPCVHTVYVRKNNQWGYNKKTYKNGRLYSSFVTTNSIPAGTGFWYERRTDTNGVLKVIWQTWRED